MTITDYRATYGLRALSMALLTLLWFGGFATAVQAQGDDVPARAHRLGPLYVAPTVALRDVGVDSNVYNLRDAASDFTFTVRPAVEAGIRRRRGTLTLHSVTDLVYFAREESERAINHDVGANGRLELRRLFLTGAGAYQNTRQRPNEEIDARSRRVERTAEAGVGVAITPKLSAQVIGRHGRTMYDADAVFEGTSLAEKLNRDARTLVGSVRYDVTPLTAVVLAHDVVRTEFRRAPVRDARSSQTMLGVDLNPRALISGSVRLGHQRLRPDNVLTPDFDGLVGSADVIYRFRRSTAFGVAFDRRLAYSYSEHEPYYVRDGFRLSMSRQVLDRVDLEVSGGRFWHRYRRVLLAPDDAGEGHTAKLRDGSVAVGYRLRPGTRLVMGLAYRDRAEPDDRGYESLSVVSSVSYAF